MTKLRRMLPYAIVVVLYAAVRLVFLDHVAHNDEQLWLGRSLNFYRALATGEFEYTYQKEHPGVMTMWAGTLTYLVRYPSILEHVHENNANPKTYIDLMWSWGMRPTDVLVALRVGKILMQTVFFAITLVFLARLLNRWTTILFGFMLALHRTIFGWDSWMHLDGLAGITAMAGLCATCYAAETTGVLERPSRRNLWVWAMAGAVCATSWLTRSTGILLGAAPVLALVFQIAAHREGGTWGAHLRKTLLGSFACLAAWCAGALATTFLLFPALWVQPVDTVRRILGMPVSGAMGEGAESFFPSTASDPGWLYYPREILVRTTPFEWFGFVVIVLAGYVAWKKGYLSGAAWRLSMTSLVFGLLFLGALSLSPRKGERYVLTVYPLITLIAAIGIDTALRFATARLSRIAVPVSLVVASVIVGFSGISVARSLPYKIVYNNPVVLAITGEGPSFPNRPGFYDLASYFLDLDRQGPIVVTVNRGGVADVLEYYIAPSEGIQFVRISTISSPSEWFDIDYHITNPTYPTSEIAEREAVVAPLMRVEAGGYVLWGVYPGQSIPAPSNTLRESACEWDFGNRTTLYQVERVPGSINLYFLSRDGGDFNVEVTAAYDSDWSTLGQETVTPQRTKTLHRVSFETDWQSSPADKDVVLSITVSDADGNVLAANAVDSPEYSDHAQVNLDCYVHEPDS